MKAVLTAVVPAVAALALVSAAQARSFASVVIGGPTITLTDLALDDGITPAYAEGGPGIMDFDYLIGPAPVSTEAIGNAFTSESETGISGHASGPDASFFVLGDRYAPSFSFTVTPGTAVTVGFDYQLNTSVTDEPFRGDSLPSATAGAELALVAVNNLRSNEGGELEYDLLAHEVDFASLESSSDAVRASLEERRGHLTATFQNLSTDSAVFAFRAEMLAYGFSAPAWAGEGGPGLPAAPVPEPETYALMLAGLAAIGWQARRRRSETT